MDSKRFVTLGRISGAYGVKGWLKVHSETDPIQNIVRYKPWFLQQNNQWHEYAVIQGRKHGKGVIVQLEDCADRDKAESLKGCQIAIQRDQMPNNENDDFYWTDLEGLLVKTLEGDELGRVSHLFETGSNDVLVVKGDKERLIPFIRDQVIESIDLETQLIVVNWDKDF